MWSTVSKAVVAAISIAELPNTEQYQLIKRINWLQIMSVDKQPW